MRRRGNGKKERYKDRRQGDRVRKATGQKRKRVRRGEIKGDKIGNIKNRAERRRCLYLGDICAVQCNVEQ